MRRKKSRRDRTVEVLIVFDLLRSNAHRAFVRKLMEYQLKGRYPTPGWIIAGIERRSISGQNRFLEPSLAQPLKHLYTGLIPVFGETMVRVELDRILLTSVKVLSQVARPAWSARVLMGDANHPESRVSQELVQALLLIPLPGDPER